MARASSNDRKITFGARRKGKASKSHNKHDKREKNYRGQGR